MREVIAPALQPQARGAGRVAPRARRPRRHRHGDQRLRHRADRRRLRRRRDLIAAALERDADGAPTGPDRRRAVVSRGQGRACRDNGWPAGGAGWADFERISVYSDSLNDLPLLERATDPVATNPSPALEAIARERGWRILQPVRMIKKFIDKLLGKSGQGRRAHAARQARRGAEVASTASTRRWSTSAPCKVVATLADAGHEAYIVGGAVRDLLRRPAAEGLRRRHQRHARAGEGAVPARLHHRPALSHRPRRVRPRPQDSRGDRGLDLPRRTSTPPPPSRSSGNEKTSRKDDSPARATSSTPSGRVLRDNVWGPQIEDAARRDFTVNAMYYDPVREIVVDYHGGIKDAKKKLLRMIGDPATRYREDPVRIIRVVRFAAKLGFEIEPKTRAPIKEMAALLDNVPQSRTFDEMIKLLQTGHALASDRRAEEAGPAPRRLPGPRRRARRGAAPRRPREVRPASRSPTPTRASPKASRSRRASCSPAMLWHDVQDALAAASGRGRAAVPGAAAGDRRGVRRAHRRHLRPRQAGRRHARDLDDAAALRAPRRQLARSRWSSSRAFAPASTSCACAPRPARSIRSWPVVGGAVPGGRREAARPARQRSRDARTAPGQARTRRRRAGGGRGDAARPRAERSRAARRSRTTRRRRATAASRQTTAVPRPTPRAPRKRRRRRRRPADSAGTAELSAAMAAPTPAHRTGAMPSSASAPTSATARDELDRAPAPRSPRCRRRRWSPARRSTRRRRSTRPAATTSTPSRSFAPRSRRSSCCARCRRSSRATAASGRSPTRRARSTSTCCSTATSSWRATS